MRLAVIIHHDVGRLEVAVDHALLMGMVEAPAIFAAARRPLDW